ncbi:AAA family ATPase [Chloroflexia bacterium SDU3-3]|nr:AAA family ATPase [Chloroflexia bacterium SDU3-3]
MTTFQFFSGKGGVGKTSMACATAIRHADAGRRTLLVTTDPASNLADVFGQPIGATITPITRVPDLAALEIDPDVATAAYKERAIAPLRAVFPPEVVAVLDEQLSGPCTAEVAAFDRFTDVLDAPTDGQQPFDVVIFDTAPTGHTLRLIALPLAWTHAIAAAEQGSGQTCIGPTALIQEAKHKYARAVALLQDPARSRFTLVLQPEATAIAETARAISELQALGITSQELIINGVIPASEAANPLFAARRMQQQQALAQIADQLPVPSRQILLWPGELMGVARLRALGQQLQGADATPLEDGPAPIPADLVVAQPESALARLRPAAGTRLIFFTGKGGVGKTVLSCITAVWLADQGYRTLLVTTDPAAHLGQVLDAPIGEAVAPVAGILGLSAAKIDPAAAGAAYKAQVLAEAAAQGRSAAALAMMQEELDSPCTEEIAAFEQFVTLAGQEDWEVIVFDTAPTGHTLRMLSLPMAWSQQLAVKVSTSSAAAEADQAAQARFATVIRRMQDPQHSTVAMVMTPEATPILEAQRAAAELGALGMLPGVVVANGVLPPAAGATPFGQARQAMQAHYLAHIQQQFAVPLLLLPLQPHAVQGTAQLRALGQVLLPAS